MEGTMRMKDGKVVTNQETPADPEPSITSIPGMPTPDAAKPETIPANLFSMGVKRLEVHGEREGYRRYWQNDDGDAIELMLKSGWTFVERTDIQLNAAVTPRNTNLGSYVSQWVGTDARGQPMHAYLMEKPEWLDKLHQEGPGSREDYHRQIEEQIMAGTLGETSREKRYSATRNPWAPGSPTGLAPISATTKFVR